VGVVHEEQAMMTGRVFTAEKEPPFGEQLWVMSAEGDRFFWDGKRVRREGTSHMEADAWPPEDSYEGEQFYEILPRTAEVDLRP
jgi:hypothetical protein